MERPATRANYHTNIRVSGAWASDSKDNVPVHGECWEQSERRGQGYTRVKGIQEYTIMRKPGETTGTVIRSGDLNEARKLGLTPLCYMCREEID